MTELSFLIELLLNHDLKKETKDAVAARIREVEGRLIVTPAQQTSYVLTPSPPVTFAKNAQAPSTLAIMAKHGDIPNPFTSTPPEQPNVPVENIAQNAVTAAAMAARQQAISVAASGKPLAGETSPRKFRGAPK